MSALTPGHVIKFESTHDEFRALVIAGSADDEGVFAYPEDAHPHDQIWARRVRLEVRESS